MVQWLGLCASTAKDTSSISGWGAEIPHTARCGQKEKTKTGRQKLRACIKWGGNGQ